MPLKNRVLTALPGIDFTLPDETAWADNTSGWTTYTEDALYGDFTEQVFNWSDSGGGYLRAYGRVADQEATYGAYRIFRGDQYLLIGGRQYSWDFWCSYVSQNGYYPREHGAKLYTYTNYAGTEGEALLDEVSALTSSSVSTQTRTVVLPLGTKAVKFKFWSRIYTKSNSCGVAWRDNYLRLD